MKARCMTTLPPGDQNEFVSAVPLPDTVSKSIQAFVQEFCLFVSSAIGCGLDSGLTLVRSCSYRAAHGLSGFTAFLILGFIKVLVDCSLCRLSG